MIQTQPEHLEQIGSCNKIIMVCFVSLKFLLERCFEDLDNLKTIHMAPDRYGISKLKFKKKLKLIRSSGGPRVQRPLGACLGSDADTY